VLNFSSHFRKLTVGDPRLFLKERHRTDILYQWSIRSIQYKAESKYCKYQTIMDRFCNQYQAASSLNNQNKRILSLGASFRFATEIPIWLIKRKHTDTKIAKTCFWTWDQSYFLMLSPSDSKSQKLPIEIQNFSSFRLRLNCSKI